MLRTEDFRVVERSDGRFHVEIKVADRDSYFTFRKTERWVPVSAFGTPINYQSDAPQPNAAVYVTLWDARLAIKEIIRKANYKPKIHPPE